MINIKCATTTTLGDLGSMLFDRLLPAVATQRCRFDSRKYVQENQNVMK